MFLLIVGIFVGVAMILGGIYCALNPEAVERLADQIGLRSGNRTFEERVRGQRFRGWLGVPVGALVIVLSIVNFLRV